MNIELSAAEKILLYRSRAVRARHEAQALALSSPALAGVKSAYALACEDIADITELTNYAAGVWHGRGVITEIQKQDLWSLHERTGEIEPGLNWICYSAAALSDCCKAKLQPEGGRNWRGPVIDGYFCSQCAHHCNRIFVMPDLLPIRIEG